MIEKISSCCRQAAQGIANGANTLKTKCELFGRKVSDLTKDVWQKNRQSLPYTAALAPFALVGVGVLAATASLVATRLLEDRLGQERSKHIYQGIRNFCAFGAGLEMVRSAITLNPVFLIKLPFYFLLGSIANELSKPAAQRVL